MLVYADRAEVVDACDGLQDLSKRLSEIRAMPAGLGRHARLVGVLIACGRLVQGAEDVEAPNGQLNSLLASLAAAVVRSWDSHFEATGELPSVGVADLPRWLELREPEGFAFYAVYPESYIEAARRLRLCGPPRVIAIRSIGTSLGAVVAAALDAPPAVTVRPFGDPFARQVDPPPHIIDAHSHYVIVDEGPGLSGSSFGCVADWLDDHGVPLERIAFLSSHDGDLGPQSSERHRVRWSRAQRIAADFDPSFLHKRFGPLEDFNVGRPLERRKYRAGRGADSVLLKFAGLGDIGERKLQIARTLHWAGLTPEPLELVHGFLVERWCGDAQPLGLHEKPLQEIGCYIAARAALLPAPSSSGATIEQLLDMCRRNVGLALGEDAARALDLRDAAQLERCVQRVCTDNKLDREEWLRAVDGCLIKTDALDHHRAHDLIGCQDVAWDVAGAAAEFDLTNAEIDRLAAIVEHRNGRPLDRDLLRFYQLAYCCFRFGQAALTGDRAEQRYRQRLGHLLDHQHVRSATPRESLVD